MTRGSVPDMAGYQSEDFCKSFESVVENKV